MRTPTTYTETEQVPFRWTTQEAESYGLGKITTGSI
jgi:hypothetical protein